MPMKLDLSVAGSSKFEIERKINIDLVEHVCSCLYMQTDWLWTQQNQKYSL